MCRFGWCPGSAQYGRAVAITLIDGSGEVCGVTAGRSATELAEQLEAQAAEAARHSARMRSGAAGERTCADAVRPLLDRGWVMLEDRAWTGTRAGNIDLLLIGCGGVVVIDAKNWHVAPAVVDGVLYNRKRAAGDDIGRLLAMSRSVAAEADIVESGTPVIPMMMFAGYHYDATLGTALLIGSHNAVEVIEALPPRFGAEQVDRVSAALAEAFPTHTANRTAVVEEPALDLLYERLHSRSELAEHGTLEDWLSYLHPAQADAVHRNFGGPARISGPAGTGKTLVGLYRAARLAQHGHAPILVTTFVNNLAAVHRSLFARIAPDLVSQVHFRTLDAFAKQLVERRLGRTIDVTPKRANNAFVHALGRVNLEPLRDRRMPGSYWQEELLHVIEGRGIVELDDYLKVERPGRRQRLLEHHRRAVWELYLEYQQRLKAYEVYDFADVQLMALECLRERPFAPAYRAVIVDEAQDVTLVGMRMMYSLVGDAPNGLLLLGDVQQSLYPARFRLGDAGLSIVGGRSVKLRVNFRNGPAIGRVSQSLLDGVTTEDVDGSSVSGTEGAVVIRTHDEVVDVTASSRRELDLALIAALRACADRGSAAVLCPTNAAVARYLDLLAAASIEAQPLKKYGGISTTAVKVGTYHSSKGIEFKYVYLPHYNPHDSDQPDPDVANQRRHELHVAVSRARDLLWRGTLT
jgi:hypothetical protein